LFLNDEAVKPDLEAELMETLINLLEALSFWGWIAIIVIGGLTVEGVVKVKRMQIKHAERMAKIQQGIDPGDETEAYKKDEV
jgi:thiamine monophosphate synthase